MRGNRAGKRGRWAALLAVLALVLAGCSGAVDLDTEDPVDSPPPASTTEAPRPISTARAPEEPYTLIPLTDPADLAVAVSRAYLTGAQVAVLAPRGDRAAVLRASSIAAAVGAPVLLSGEVSGSLNVELLRLGVVGVVTVGAVDIGEVDTTSLTVAPAPDDAAALGKMLGTSLTDVPMPTAADTDDIAALLDLGPGEVFAPGEIEAAPPTSPSDAADEPSDPAQSDPASSDPSGATTPPDTTATDEATGAATPPATTPPATTPPATTPPVEDPPVTEPTPVGELPALAPPEQVEDSLVLFDGDPAQLAAVANALAVGADVSRVTGDIAGDPDLIAHLSELAPSTVVGLGTSLGDDDTFEWHTATAVTGVQLPGGGQMLFNGKRYVALYGSPVTPSLGILGEQDTDETVARAASYASSYADLTDDTVVPALEIIVTVASGSAGEDGNYSTEWPSKEFVPLIEAAQAAGQYVVLDFQPGRSSFVDQVKAYEDLLAYPNVGVALDPEWRLGPDQVHLQQIGSVGIDEVNDVVDLVADFVQSHDLPQKLIVLHQFQLRMIHDRQDLDTSRDEVAVLIHADGQGSQPAKQDTWRALHQDAPRGVHWGWKNFIDEDSPMLTPDETYTEVDPIPDFVSYQ